MGSNSNSGMGSFCWDSAKSYANFSVEDEERMKQVLSFDDLDNVPLKYYHLPSLNNLSCILPSHTKSFTEKYDLEEIDSMAYGIYDQDPNVVRSSYYSKGDGVIYAIRPIKSWSSAAFRYQYKPNEGLVVDIVPLGSAAFKVKSAQEISDGEIFSRSASFFIVSERVLSSFVAFETASSEESLFEITDFIVSSALSWAFLRRSSQFAKYSDMVFFSEGDEVGFAVAFTYAASPRFEVSLLDAGLE